MIDGDGTKRSLESCKRGKMLQDTGCIAKGKRYWAMHEANFWSCWLKEVGEDKKAREMEIVKHTKEEVSEERVREEEKEENGTVSVESLVCQFCLRWGFWCFSQGEELESGGNLIVILGPGRVCLRCLM